MSKIRTILKGFVDINLETDENINTKIIIEKSFSQEVSSLNSFSLRAFSPESDKIELPVDFSEILNSVGITDQSSISLAHIKGSRLYGVEKNSSDWDIVAISSSIKNLSFRESTINNEEFDVHLYSPEAFNKKLEEQSIREIEVIFHPSKVRIINDVEYFFNLDKNKLIEKVKNDSDEIWNIGENILKTNTLDSYRALKNFWHSFRFLIFAKQILESGSIYDFSAANQLYAPIVNSKQVNYSFFEENFSPLRESLKEELNNYIEQ
jgi:predicted nucleotidyltransferase